VCGYRQRDALLASPVLELVSHLILCHSYHGRKLLGNEGKWDFTVGMLAEVASFLLLGDSLACFMVLHRLFHLPLHRLHTKHGLPIASIM